MEALFINVGDSYQERGWLDSSGGTNSRCRPSRARLRGGPGTSSSRTRCTDARHAAGAMRNRTASFGFGSCQEWRAPKSSGGRPRVTALWGLCNN